MKGAWGERAARTYLAQCGMDIVVCNYRVPGGEIDLIAREGEYIVFVEVKTRRNADYGRGCAYVTLAKQRKIIDAARRWLYEYACDLQPRFDVIEVYGREGDIVPPEIVHWRAAFEAHDG